MGSEMHTRTTAPPAIADRLAGAPISWGVCEIPGWGRRLPPARVLAEMAALGLRATELGAPGFLPDDPVELRERLDEHGIELVGAFVPLVLHEAAAEAAKATAETVARRLAATGADVLVVAVVTDEAWSPRLELDDDAWRRVGARLDEISDVVGAIGLTLALHPHAGTLVETAADVERAIEVTGVGWCLDSGHLLIGGVDPSDFVRRHGDRIVHAHLKDVDATLAARVRDGELSLLQATQAGLFKPLGTGGADISRVMALLDAQGYERWLVLEQDTAITGPEPPVGSGPILDVRQSVEFLDKPAPTRRRAPAR